jgi:hypothetical protein
VKELDRGVLISKTPQNKQNWHPRTKFVDDHEGIDVHVLLTESSQRPVMCPQRSESG